MTVSVVTATVSTAIEYVMVAVGGVTCAVTLVCVLAADVGFRVVVAGVTVPDMLTVTTCPLRVCDALRLPHVTGVADPAEALLYPLDPF